MGEHRPKADGRRVFSTDFKRAAVQRIVTGEKTVAELSRALDIAPSVIRSMRTARRWIACWPVRRSAPRRPPSCSTYASASIPSC
jgi:transposase-like protein